VAPYRILEPARRSADAVDGRTFEEILAAMREPLRRATIAALLGLMVVAAGSGVAKAIAQLEHACCDSATTDAMSAPQPCHGFLPLSCCQNEALPATEPSHTPVSLALPALRALDPIAPERVPATTSVAPIPRASPLRLSVVLQV
jgi:hypothetical protein